jgi:N-acetylglutamate synthase-like GNAT family acetyltransferase
MLIRTLTHSDFKAVGEFMQTFPELAYQPWENDLLPRLVRDHPEENWVAEEKGKIVAALLGGSFMGRGTISHVAVDPELRSLGLGRQIVDQSIAGFRVDGCHVVHVIVVAGNDRGLNFWRNHMGFVSRDGTTLEADVHDGETGSFQQLRREDIPEVVRLVNGKFSEHQRRKLAEISLRSGCSFVHRSRGEMRGVVLAGSFGVRGAVGPVVTAANDQQLASDLVHKALGALGKKGVLRAHVLLRPGDDPQPFETVGFAEQPGESTLELPL